MARIRLTDVASATDIEARAYRRFPSNLVRGLLRTTPDLTNGYLDLGAALAKSALPPKLREMVILRVATISCSAYELMQHIDIAKAAGVSEQGVTAVQQGDYTGLTDQEVVLLRFVDELVVKPKATDTFDAALATLGEEHLATVILLVGHYMTTARFLETLAIDLDDKPTSWSSIG